MNQLKAKIKRSLDGIYVEFNGGLFGPYEEVFDNDQVYYNSKNKIYNLIKNFYPNVIFAYKKIQDLNLNDIKFLHIIDIHNRKDINLKFEILNYIYSDLINKTIIINIDNKKITINQRTLDIINEEIEEIIEIKKFELNIPTISPITYNIMFSISKDFFYIISKNNNYILSKIGIIKNQKTEKEIYNYFFKKYNQQFNIKFFFIFIIIINIPGIIISIQNKFPIFILLTFILGFIYMRYYIFKINKKDINECFYENNNNINDEIKYIETLENYKNIINIKKLDYIIKLKYFNIINFYKNCKRKWMLKLLIILIIILFILQFLIYIIISYNIGNFKI